MNKQFQPCPKCGNCDFFRKAVRDKDGKIIDRKHGYDYCGINAVPVWVEIKGTENKERVKSGYWACEPFKARTGKRKKTRRNKPWQNDRIVNHREKKFRGERRF